MVSEGKVRYCFIHSTMGKFPVLQRAQMMVMVVTVMYKQHQRDSARINGNGQHLLFVYDVCWVQLAGTNTVLVTVLMQTLALCPDEDSGSLCWPPVCTS